MVRTGTITAGGADLSFREVGQGPPILVIHGGPGFFDHTYLLPGMDRLGERHRLISYDQRCTGGSTGDEAAARDVDVATFVRDLDAVRAGVGGLDTVALLGHSWGGHLAMQYAVRHPERVSGLVLMNTSPATKRDYDAYERYRARLTAAVRGRLDAFKAMPEFVAGDPDTVADAMRLSLSVGIVRPEDAERLQLRFSREDVVRGRAVAARLDEVLFGQEFDLTPQLASLQVPTLLLHGDRDFIPLEAGDAVEREVGRFLPR